MTDPESQVAEYSSPFGAWAELTGALRDRFLREIRLDPGPPSVYVGSILGQLAGLTTHCRHLGAALEDLRRHDPPAYEAFLRALESA